MPCSLKSTMPLRVRASRFNSSLMKEIYVIATTRVFVDFFPFENLHLTDAELLPLSRLST